MNDKSGETGNGPAALGVYGEKPMDVI